MNSSRKNYLSILIFGILSILLMVFVVYPIFREIKELSESLFLEKNKIVYFKKQKEELQKTEDFYKAHQADLNKMESLFIDPEVPVEFINFLETTASRYQINLEISSMAKGTDKKVFWPSLSLQLLAKGSFSNFSKFLDTVENGPYLIEVLELGSKKLTEREKQTEEITSEANTSNMLVIRVFTK